jgi:hypothetical protein
MFRLSSRGLDLTDCSVRTRARLNGSQTFCQNGMKRPRGDEPNGRRDVRTGCGQLTSGCGSRFSSRAMRISFGILPEGDPTRGAGCRRAVTRGARHQTRAAASEAGREKKALEMSARQSGRVHLWLGAGVGGVVLEISARHRSNRALSTTVLIGALEMPGLAAT